MLLAVIATALLLGSAFRVSAVAPSNEHFQRTWARTDLPVSSGQVSRTWMWGPDGFTGEIDEPYAESPGGQRAVQYFDKARMEITNPSGDTGSIWYVTNGLLVVELISGQLQIGDASFNQRQPATVNVAGDSDDPTGPTYASFGNVLNAQPLPIGAPGAPHVIAQSISRSGAVIEDLHWANYGIGTAHLDEITNHSIARPFWAFMNSVGVVNEDGASAQAPLFENPYFATGRPITEAYWANVKVGGSYQDVLMQCFERRCLTYNPDNAPEWQVEAGNVGRHYYAWRYDRPADSPTPTSSATATSTANESVTSTSTSTGTVVPSPTSAASATLTATAMATPDTATSYESAGTWGQPFIPDLHLYNPIGVEVDQSGHYWVADTNNNRIVEFDEDGIQLRAIGTEGSGPLQFKRPFDVAFDSDGNIYVAEFEGYRVQKIAADGSFIKTWGVYGAALGQFDKPAGIAVSGDTVYVTEYNNHRVQFFDLDGTFRGSWGVAGSGNTNFNYPVGIDVAPGGSVLVADWGNNRIQKFDPTGIYLGQFGSLGSSDGQFNGPWGIDTAGDGTIYVAEAGNNRIQVFSANGDYLRKWAGDGTQPGNFRSARSVAWDGDSHVYVVDSKDSQVLKFTIEGAFVYELGDNRRGRFGILAGIEVDEQGRVLVPDGLSGYPRIQIYENDGTPINEVSPSSAPAAMSMPVDVAIGPNGNRYVVDGNVIRYFNSSWEYIGLWTGQFVSPQGIATDADGNVYVVDTGNNRIQKFDAAGNLLTMWGSAGSGDGQFESPSFIAAFGALLYVTDSNNARIQVFDRAGDYVGKWGSQGAGNGEFNNPIGIAADSDGYLYVVDHGNGRIQKFAANGQFVATWGSEGNAPGQLNAPWGIAVDTRGYVFVTEAGGNRVQSFRPMN